MGRPAFEFSQPIADRILERISEGEDLTSICKDRDLPGVATIYKWLHHNVGFADAYAAAREVQAEGLADKAQQIAERTHVQLPNGLYVAADPQRDRLAVDTIKWRAAHLRPKVWGDKQFVEHSGSLTLIDVSEEELVEELLALVISGRLPLPNGAQLVVDDPEPDDFDHEDLA
jgi:hypothetical protein